MKIKSGFFINEMGNEFVVVAMSNDAKKAFGGMLRLNETGAFLFKQLETDKTQSQLVEALVERYSVDKAEAESDFLQFIETLRGVDLIDE